MKVKIKTMSNYAKLPTYATPGSACFDLYAAEAGMITISNARIISTGLKFEVPEGYVLNVYSRSGNGFKDGIRLSNCVGKIDSDYRGEVKVALHNDGNAVFYFNIGDRIAQAEIVPVNRIEFEEVAELSETSRGEGGFGSTGK